jgi:imidazole glycerol-phosphate synthase subunit HisH
MIQIIDYGMGNLHSILKAFHRLNIAAQVVVTPDEVLKAQKLVIPGVGHFKNGMERLKALGYIEVLNQKVMIEKTPVLGICLGAQLLTSYSEEGDVEGLGWITASTRKFAFDDDNKQLKIPHMGWNQIVNQQMDSPLLSGINQTSSFYFVHSYFITCNDESNGLAQTVYGFAFDSIILKDNIMGVQFHPEKSHQSGLRLLRNFASL